MSEQEDDRFQAAVRRASEVLGGADNAMTWLHTPQIALASTKPIDLLVDEVGLARVLNLIGAIEDGGYA